MNHFSEVERMRSTVEELSVKKQLPRRQHTDKPVLKYDRTFSSPVHLFNHSDAISRCDARGQRVSSPGMPANQRAQNNSAHRGASINHKRVRNGSSGSNHSSPSRSISNPYSRPVSADEIFEGVLQANGHHRHHGKIVGAHPIMSAMPPYHTPIHYGGTDHVSPAGNSGLQLNSFVRPQSEAGHDSTTGKSSSLKRNVGAAAGDTAVFALENHHIQEDVRNVVRMSKEGLDQSGRATLQQAFALASSASATAVTGLPPRPKIAQTRERHQEVSSGYQTSVTCHPDSSPSKSYTNMSGSNNNDRTATRKGNEPVRSSTDFALLNGRQPGSHVAGAKHLNGLKTLSSSLEVPLAKPINGRVEPLALSGDISSMASVDESGLPLHNLTASSLLNTRMGMLRKMPVTNTLAGTLYYKKSYRDANKQVEQKQHPAQRVILEQRPRGDGAPSKQARMATDEKLHLGLRYNEAEEEEDDDISTPSGERLPGDGEASIDGIDDDDDDGIDDLYEDSQDDGEDDYTICSSLSSASTVRLKSASSHPSTTQSAGSRLTAAGEEQALSVVRPLTSSGDVKVQPALRQSLFPAVPPTINFVSEGENVEKLPWEIRKLLKWRMSPITPNVVKSVLRRSNFRITKKNNDWLGCFGKHMKANAFKSIREYQKLNHFPGSFQLGRKDRLWRNLSRMQVSFGKKEFGFFPQTYILPQDMKQLKRSWEDATARQKWIIKPPASARGLGIKVISKWTQIPRRRPVIVQKYLGKPYLINDSKFDMRVYVYVTSFDPLRVYIYEDGLARFASCKYSSSMKNLNNKFMHLTNYSINKRNVEYQSNTDDTVCQGHKWSLKSLWNYLKEEGVNTQGLWDSIKDIVIKTLISADGSINTMVKSNVRSRYVVHELFGFDILLDEQLRPWILEVNISPSLHSSSPLDVNIKGQMMRDMMNLAGFRVPDKNDIINSAHSTTTVPDLSAHVPSNDYCMDKRLFTNQVSADERAKHAFFCHKHQDEQVLQGILDILTPDDVRILMESIDEDSRKGGFIRVFPTPTTKKYLRYFEQPRYYNILLDQWVARYNRMEQRGISMLQSLCEEGIHLENSTSNTRHQWCPPNSAAAMLSARDKNSSPLKKDVLLGQVKPSPTSTRLPRVRNGGGETHVPTIVTGPPASSPVPRPPRPLDPTR